MNESIQTYATPLSNADLQRITASPSLILSQHGRTRISSLRTDSHSTASGIRGSSFLYMECREGGNVVESHK